MNFYPKYKNYYSLFNDKGAVGDITQAGEEMLKVLNVELKYTALKQLLATALAISLGGLLLEYVPLGFNDLMEGYFPVFSKSILWFRISHRQRSVFSDCSLSSGLLYKEAALLYFECTACGGQGKKRKVFQTWFFPQ